MIRQCHLDKLLSQLKRLLIPKKVGLLLLMLSNGAWATAEDVHIGILSYRPVQETTRQWQPLADYLQQQLPAYRFHIHAYDYDELETVTHQRQLDFVFTNPGHYVLMHQHGRLSAPLVTMVNTEFGRPIMAFGGVMLVRSDDQRLQQASDLHGMRVASPASGSLGGYLMQRYELQELGIKPMQLEMQFTGMPHDLAIDALLGGHVDAAFVRTGVMESLQAQGKIPPMALRVLNQKQIPQYPYALSTRLYPEWPFAAMTDTAPSLTRQVTAALLAIPHGSDLSRSMHIHGFSIPLDYQQVQQVMQNLRVAPYDTRLGRPASVTWKEHYPLLLILALSLFMILVLSLALRRNRHKLLQQTALLKEQRLAHSMSEQRLEHYFQVSPVIHYSLKQDEQGLHTRWVSSNITRLLGYTQEEALAEGWWLNNLYPDDRHDALSGFSQLDKKKALTNSYRFYKKNRTVIWVLDQLRIIDDQTDSNIIGAWTDITETEQARKQLQAEASHRKMLMASLGEGVYGTDINGNCSFINPAALAMLGLTEQEVIGQHQHLLFHHHRPDGSHYPANECPIHHTLQDGKSRHVEEWFIRNNGEGFSIDLTVSAIEQDGERIGCVVVFRDTSERKQRELKTYELNQFRQAILDHNAAAIFVGSPDLKIRMANRRALELFAYQAEELVGKSFECIHVNQENYDNFAEHYQKITQGETIVEATWPFLTRSGDIIWCEAYGTAVNPEQPDEGLIWTLIDVTESHQIEERNQLLVSALEAAANAIVITDTEARIEWTNQAFEQLSGYSREEAIGRRPSELISSGMQDRNFYQQLWATILAGKTWRGEIINKKKSGEQYHEELIIAPVRNKSGEVEHFVGVKQDISVRKHMEEQLEHMAVSDFLTGLPNRRYFISRLEEELARQQRNPDQASALLMLDIDRFKQINDQHGHIIGDQALQKFADLIRQRLRKTDLAGRIGGEEFALLLSGAKLDDAYTFAEKLRTQTQQLAIELENGELAYMSISIGITSLNQTDQDPDQTLARADKAMYQAKQNGRNRVEVLEQPE